MSEADEYGPGGAYEMGEDMAHDEAYMNVPEDDDKNELPEEES